MTLTAAELETLAENIDGMTYLARCAPLVLLSALAQGAARGHDFDTRLRDLLALAALYSAMIAGWRLSAAEPLDGDLPDGFTPLDQVTLWQN